MILQINILRFPRVQQMPMYWITAKHIGVNNAKVMWKWNQFKFSYQRYHGITVWIQNVGYIWINGLRLKRFVSIWVTIINANILCIMSILFREASRICSIHVSIWFSMGSNRSYREIHSQFVTIWYLDMSWWEGKQPKHVNEIVMLHLQKLTIHAMLYIERLFDW